MQSMWSRFLFIIVGMDSRNVIKKIHYKNGAIKYEGEIANGLFHGQGIKYLSDSQIFVNKWENGDFDFDVAWFMLETFEGEFKNGKPDGKGTQKYIAYERKTVDVDCNYNYEVQLLHEYKGIWVNGELIDGKYFYKGKLVDKGFRKGLSLHGRGIIYQDNGKKQLEGEFDKGVLSGQGVSFFGNGSKQFDGYWKDGVTHGKGTSYYKNGKIKYHGQFKKGAKCGRGIMYSKRGELKHKGRWIRDEFIGPDRFYLDSIKWFCNIFKLKEVLLLLLLLSLYVIFTT